MCEATDWLSRTQQHANDKRIPCWHEYITDTSAVKYPQVKTCYGYEGKGWVVASGQAQKCPVCEGNGKYGEIVKFVY